MILLPDASTAYIDPFMARKTLVIHTFVADPLTQENYTRDPRYIARKAEDYLIRVNRQLAPIDLELRLGDRVSITPVKIEGAM